MYTYTRESVVPLQYIVIAGIAGLATLVWWVQHLIGATNEHAMRAFIGSLLGIAVGWSGGHALKLEGFDWLSAGLALTLCWIAWSGMVNDIGVYHVAQAYAGILEMGANPEQWPFYTDAWFKAVVGVGILFAGGWLRYRVG